ncbi:PREDICTED: coiled-coil domain-containing protein 115-like [Priapulus caudatus]|uniref:Vacuolar ATPase assembly protein VMA22 n=1 Tax=Priapulus caudatus TaxID=37621 RepID=A0ABM1DVI3_PRICU|nr:PREDICTED: coiled-coil domain-containing protein 115-like [Priapulus caudatus]
MEYSEVCELIDSNVVEYLTTLEEILQYSADLESAVRDGYWFMSKARSVMGQKLISELQVPINCDMVASVSVDCGEVRDDVPVLSSAANLSNQHVMFSIAGASDGEAVLSGGVRQRNKGANTAPATDCSLTNDDAETNTVHDSAVASKIKDPLKWFGILVPQSLRQSQAAFKTTLPLVVKLANRKCKLGVLRQQHQQLLKMKAEIKSRDVTVENNE